MSKNEKNFKILFFSFFFGILQANISIDNILAKIEERNDLSLKTRKERGGVSYVFIRHDLISLKGENLLNKANENSYYISDMSTFLPKQPFFISPIYRRVILSLEWYF